MQRITNRNEQLKRLRWRYAKRGKAGKSSLLDEFCDHYGYERKYAIKLLQGRPEPSQPRARPGPEPKYEPVQEVVERIWNCAEQLCGKRLAPALGLWLPHYVRHFGPLLPTQKKLLGSISAATLDRLLTHCRARAGRGKNGTRPGSLPRHQVPIQGEVWDERRLGFLEADSVALGSDLSFPGQRMLRLWWRPVRNRIVGLGRQSQPIPSLVESRISATRLGRTLQNDFTVFAGLDPDFPWCETCSLAR
jgi:hypothetical protein